MSGVEVVGIIASAAQLAQYGLLFIGFLSATHEKIRDAPGEIEQHLSQIHQLLGIIDYIQQSTSPQNPIVLTNLDFIHRQAKQLADVLNRILRRYRKSSIKFYWQIVRGREEKQISAIFGNLEKTKSALTLYVASSQKDLLDDINTSLARLEEAISRITGTMEQFGWLANNNAGVQMSQEVMLRRNEMEAPHQTRYENNAIVRGALPHPQHPSYNNLQYPSAPQGAGRRIPPAAPPPVNGYGPAWTVPNAGNTHKQTPYPEESHIAENVTISEDARVINGHDGMRDSRAEVTKTFKMTEVNVSGKATYVNGISYHNSSSK